MKKILLLCALIAAVAVVLIYRHTRMPNLYGTFTSAPKAEIADLIEAPKKFIGKTFYIEGIIKDQCTTMGCFFFFYVGDKSLRVDLAEIAMHAPRHRNGRPARLEGQIVPYGEGYQFYASAVEFQ